MKRYEVQTDTIINGRPVRKGQFLRLSDDDAESPETLKTIKAVKDEEEVKTLDPSEAVDSGPSGPGRTSKNNVPAETAADRKAAKEG